MSVDAKSDFLSFGFDISRLNEAKTCKVCGQLWDNLSHFWRQHKIASKKYFAQNFPRINPALNKAIYFKDFDSYFLNDFASKEEMRDWFRTLNDYQIVDYCKNLLLRRKQIKSLVYSPSFVELKSVLSPTTIFYDKILYGGYYSFCKEIGLHNKFKKLYFELNPPVDDLLVFCDSREQRPIIFKHCQIKTLDFGDYTCQDSKVFIERKDFTDFVGSLGKDVERIKNEIWRAKDVGAYIVFVIESPFDFCLNFDRIQFRNFSKTTPEFIFHNVRSIMQTFDNVQFVFAEDRQIAKKLILFILRNHRDILNIDIQEFLAKSQKM